MMVGQGLLEPAAAPVAGAAAVGGAAATAPSGTDPVSGPAARDTVPAALERTPQQRYQDAYPIATRLAASLGLRGFALNLAIEGAGNYEQLCNLAPRIRASVGEQAFAELDRALNG
jgi:hypothetical protein